MGGQDRGVLYVLIGLERELGAHPQATMRPHVGNYLHLQRNSEIEQLRYKDYRSCIHLATIKNFQEFQMESRIYLTPDQLKMKFY